LFFGGLAVYSRCGGSISDLAVLLADSESLSVLDKSLNDARSEWRVVRS